MFFDHGENWYTSQWMDTVQRAFAYVSQLQHPSPVALYPGDK